MIGVSQFSNQPILLWFVFLLGLAIGSFLNVVGHRFLTEESLLHPASHCPHCKTPLRPIDNIPVLSYLMLGGQCHQCKAPISLQYPLVELGTGMLFVLIVWNFGMSLQSLFLVFFVTNLMVITITDWRESYIFEINSLSLVPAGLIYNLFNLGNASTGGIPADFGAFSFVIPHIFISAIMGIVGAFVIFEGMILISQLAFGTEGFGHGDTHLMMGVGAFLGWELCAMALVLGMVLQAAFAIPLLILQWVKQRNYTSLGSGGVAFLFGILPIFLGGNTFSPLMRGILLLACMGLTLVSLFIFLRQVKKNQSFTYMPLGPALVLGAIIALFWGAPMLQGYQVLVHHP